MVGLLWLMRQDTDLLRDVTRSVRGAGARVRDHGCDPLRLWVVRGSHTIHCGECRDIKGISKLPLNKADFTL